MPEPQVTNASLRLWNTLKSLQGCCRSCCLPAPKVPLGLLGRRWMEWLFSSFRWLSVGVEAWHRSNWGSFMPCWQLGCLFSQQKLETEAAHLAVRGWMHSLGFNLTKGPASTNFHNLNIAENQSTFFFLILQWNDSVAAKFNSLLWWHMCQQHSLCHYNLQIC